MIGSLLSLVGNDKFMSSFWTTVGYTVYIPDQRPDDLDYQVIWHEGRHAMQSKRLTRIGMGFLYLLPLSLIPLVVLGAIFSVWALVAFPVLLLPLPAYFRMKLEMQAYRTTLVAMAVAGDRVGDVTWIEDQFTGPNYYFMWPFTLDVKRRLLDAIAYATGPFNEMDGYDRVMVTWMEMNGLRKES